MTINVVVKCPQGIVMGADSLLSIIAGDGIVSSIIPYNSKLFPVGNSTAEGSSYAVGALVNGANTAAGRTIEDIIQEFGEDYPKLQATDDYSLNQMALDLGDKISKLIKRTSGAKRLSLEIILGGYSKGKKVQNRRNAEIYSIFWDNKKNYRLRILYTKDTEFGTVYGGQPKILDRFRYGIDDWMISEILERREKLFNKVCNYIIKRLRENNINIPKNTRINVPNLKEFDVFSLMSYYKVGQTIGQTMKNIKTGMTGALETMEAFFTLQTAINYCSFLMSCAYAESAFTSVIPSVGSEMRVASVTRHEGFRFRRIWEMQVPGPPFR
jgi:hypothetical protein